MSTRIRIIQIRIKREVYTYCALFCANSTNCIPEQKNEFTRGVSPPPVRVLISDLCSQTRMLNDECDSQLYRRVPKNRKHQRIDGL